MRHAASATSLRWPPESWTVGSDRSSSGMSSERSWLRTCPASPGPPISTHRSSSPCWRASTRSIRDRSAITSGRASSCSTARSCRSSSATSGRAAMTVATAVRSSPSGFWSRYAATSPRRRTISPVEGCSRSARMRSSVDFPAPFGPTTPIRAPSATSKSSPWKTVHDPNDFSTPTRAASVVTSGARRSARATMAADPRPATARSSSARRATHGRASSTKRYHGSCP
jgi:hypothetical protein